MHVHARRHVALTLLVCAALLLSLRASAAPSRGTVCYTAWDSYYFYAAFQVSDPHVFSTNTSPYSQPQQDDDVEVFFDTHGPESSADRAPGTYQMAVSAGQGAYFSDGSTSGKPLAKLIFTYKYAVTVNGPLNDPTATDKGYTVELAIPWAEMGLQGPPAAGTVWGFNVINRDRSSLAHPANRLASLSPLVRDAADVQDPKLWTKITFTDSPMSMHSDASMVYCPKVRGQYPIIDGVISSGEWFEPDGFTLGPPTIAAPAPTRAQEPNVDITAEQAFEQAVAQTPPPMLVKPGHAPETAPPVAAPHQPVAPPPSGYDVQLPGGGMLHVGKLLPPPSPPVVPPSGHAPFQTAQAAAGSPFVAASTAVVNPNLELLPQTHVSTLFAALYRDDFPSGPSYVDEPQVGMGDWFGGGSVQYQMDEVEDARRAGVNVLLVEFDPADPDAQEALACLVKALQELTIQGRDYPLLGLDLTAAGSDPSETVRSFFRSVPAEFRAETFLPDAQDDRPAYICIVPPGVDAASVARSFDTDFTGAALFVGAFAADGSIQAADGNIGMTSVRVTPVADPSQPVSDRDQGGSYNASWAAADGTKSQWAVLDSWNDFARGTDVAASRQYGEFYADITKLSSLRWSGTREWHARYLHASVPSVMAPSTLYTVSLRVENAGTLPWRLGEDFSLSYRWYRDGRLYDDSAPKLPIDFDIYPGDSRTLEVAVFPQNKYGAPMPAGRYMLVFDIVQGADKWFTMGGDVGLKVPVTILPAKFAPPASAAFLDSTLAPRLQSGAPYLPTITVRNDSGRTWRAGKTRLDFVAEPESGGAAPLSGGAALAADVAPGAIGAIKAPVSLSGPAGSRWLVKWEIRSPDMDGHLEQMVSLVAVDDGASFVLNETPRILKTGETAQAHLGIANLGPQAWASNAYAVGEHWTYLDGTPVADAKQVLTPIAGPIGAGVATALFAKFTAPTYPGRYFVVFDVRDPSGNWSSTVGNKMHAAGCLPLMVTVTAGKGSDAQPVDLAKLFDVTAAGFEALDIGDIDGNGNSIPGVQLPPDGTNDVFSNPLLTQKPGPAYYPSGFYAGAGAADHNVAFLFPGNKSGPDAVACQGQRIALPGGYQTVHILAASTGGAPETAQFTVDGPGKQQAQSITVAPWTELPTGAGVAVGLNFPYHLHSGEVDTSSPSVLGDYTIATTGGARAITLPNDTNIKVFAITVAR